MHGTRVYVALAGFWMFLAAGSPAGEIGPWGDPDRLVIVGARQIDAAAIGRAIRNDPDFAWRSHPRASLDEYLAGLQTRVAWGLQRAGFPDARVDVRVDPKAKRVVVTLDEGPRYRALGVEMSGCPDELADRLRLWLTERTPPADSYLALVERPDGGVRRQWLSTDGKPVDLEAPEWRPGEFAAFDAVKLRGLERHVARGLANAGYDDARVRTVVVRDDAARTARLQVDVLELGEPARIARIDVEGARRDGRDVVLDYLGLAIGQPMSPERRAQLEHRLRASARYRKQKVETQRGFGGAGIDVKIALVEYAPAPSLVAPLRPEEEALLRCREWILRHAERGEDLVVRQTRAADESPSVQELVLGGEAGMLVRGGAAHGRKLAFCLGAGEWGAYVSDGGGYFGVPQTTREQLRGAFRYSLSENPADERPHRIEIGGGVRSSDPETPRPGFVLDLQFEPVAMLALAHENEPRITRDGDELTIETVKHALRIDARTGRVVDLRLSFDSDSRWQVTFERAAFARRAAEIRREAGANRFDASRPASSLVAFLAAPTTTEIATNWLVAATEGRDEGPARRWSALAAVARRWSESDSLAACDSALRAAWAGFASQDDDFALPLSDEEARRAGVARMFGGWGLRYADAVFRRETWPGAVVRSMIGMYAGEPRFIEADLNALARSERFGPLGHLAASILFPHPQASVAFARQGLTRMTLAGFQGDRADVSANLARFGGDVAAVRLLRALTAEEVAELGAALVNDPRMFAELASRLRASRDEAAALRELPEALDEFWTNHLAQRVERWLQARAGLETATRPQETPR